MSLHLTRRVAVLLSSTLLLAASCAPPKPPPAGPTRDAWIAKGDATLSTQPALSLANYERAQKAPEGAASVNFEEKIKTAAAAWLRNELATRAKQTGTTPIDDLAFVARLRSKASEYSVDAALASDIEAFEKPRARALLAQRIAELSAKTPFEAIGYLISVREEIAKIPSAKEVAAEVEPHVEAQKIRMFATLEEVRAKARPGSTAQLVHEAVIAAFIGNRIDDARKKEIMRTVELDVSILPASGGCDYVTSAVQGTTVPKGGARKVTMKLDGLTCSSTESIDRETKTEHYEEEETETYTVEVPGNCPPVDPRTCIRNTMDRCDQPVCLPSYEKRTRTVMVPRTRTKVFHKRRQSGDVTGTLTITLDGATSTKPFQVSVSKVDTDESGNARFSSRTPEEMMRASAPASVRSKLQSIVSDLEREVRATYEASSERKLRAGDIEGALADLAVAAWTGGSVSSSFSTIAERAQLPFDVWRNAMQGSTPSFPSVTFAAGTASSFEMPSSDDELEKQSTTALSARLDYDRARSAETSSLVTGIRGKSLGIGLSRWQGVDDENSHGLTLGYLNTTGSVGKRFRFRDITGFLGFNSSFAVELDAHYRLGMGLRGGPISIAPYLIGGAGRRGESDVAGDTGLPLQLELGAGARLVIGTTWRKRVEVLAEHIHRPLAESMAMPADVQQRLRYEVRYFAESDGDFEAFGARGWCSFEQTTTDDLLWPSAPSTMRTCSVLAFFVYE